MRVVVLGAGGMGRYAARAAAGVDVTDEAALGSLLAGAGAVLNTVGPFFRWESTEAMLALLGRSTA